MADNNLNVERVGRSSGGRRFWKRVFEDPWRKVVALGMGVLCWYVIDTTLDDKVAGQRWYTLGDVRVGIPSETGADRYYFEDSTGRSVSLDLAVDYLHQDEEINKEDFEVEIELKNLVFTDDGRRLTPLEYEYHLSQNDVRKKPGEVEIRRIIPATLNLKWDKYVSREIPVRPNTRSWLSNGRTARTTVSPEAVIVTGPAFMVNQIDVIQTEEIALRDEDSGFKGEYDLLPPKFSECKLGRERVEVQVDIRENSEMVSRRIENVRVNVLCRMDATLEVERQGVAMDVVAVILRGAAELVNQVDEANLVAYCDLRGYSSAGVQNVKVQLAGLPEGVTARVFPMEYLTLKLVPVYGKLSGAETDAADESEKITSGERGHSSTPEEKLP